MPRPAAGARNVLLIVWDTVRAANTSLHGYRRPTTPNLLRLASRGVRFDRAFASSSWTLPSHASMLTGRWPHELRVGWKTPVRDGVPTLAGYLASHGYATAGFVANLDYCSRETGLARGFAHYEDFSCSVFDTFNRYVALGRRIDVSSWMSKIDAWSREQTGHWYDLIPRSKEHAKNADAINDAFLEMAGKAARERGGRSSRFSITTTPIARMKCQTSRYRVLAASHDHRASGGRSRASPPLTRPRSQPKTCRWRLMCTTIALPISIGGWDRCSTS